MTPVDDAVPTYPFSDLKISSDLYRSGVRGEAGCPACPPPPRGDAIDHDDIKKNVIYTSAKQSYKKHAILKTNETVKGITSGNCNKAAAGGKTIDHLVSLCMQRLSTERNC